MIYCKKNSKKKLDFSELFFLLYVQIGLEPEAAALFQEFHSYRTGFHVNEVFLPIDINYFGLQQQNAISNFFPQSSFPSHELM